VPDIALRRWIYLGLILATTAFAVHRLHAVLRVDGISGFENLTQILFVILFAWISASFWLACFGVFARWRGITLPTAPRLPASQAGAPSSSRTAILMPVYNEDVARFFSGVLAICESIGPSGEFDFFILSDSTNPAFWDEEHRAWQSLREALPGNTVYYRRRAENKGRKSGNIQDFCENWGALYDYMVVLDADSLMTGSTLKRLVRMMDANPRTALIQAPAQLAGRHSLFARIQQFASSIYGPIYNAGLSWLQGRDGNYWGHNAIIRIRPFMRHCGLPKLPGPPPFGGEIMSHDFVEAALLRRAGWDVWMAPDIGGSYEAPPPTIHDHLKRDRRWCQGNLQHLGVVFAQGLRLPSRLHLLLGIMSYLSSPLWLLLLIVSGIDMMLFHQAAPVVYFGRIPGLALPVSHKFELVLLVLATALMLYGPKFFALLLLHRDPERLRAHGGAANIARGILAESVFSTLMAPVVMLSHSWFVCNIMMGISSGWGTQQRQDRRLPLGFVARGYWLHTMIGVVTAIVLFHYAPRSFGWFVPLLAGLIFSIPLVYFTSSPTLGRSLQRAGLFLVPSEAEGTQEIPQRANALAGAYAADEALIPADSPAFAG
jgi:membrane glycosyltransferase